MSVRALTKAWEVTLEPTSKLLLIALADNADEEDHYAWPSLNTLARKTSLDRSTVKRRLTQLESLGLVTRQQRPYQSTLYQLHLDGGAHSAPRRTQHLGGAHSAPRVGAQCARNRQRTVSGTVPPAGEDQWGLEDSSRARAEAGDAD